VVFVQELRETRVVAQGIEIRANVEGLEITIAGSEGLLQFC